MTHSVVECGKHLVTVPHYPQWVFDYMEWSRIMNIIPVRRTAQESAILLSWQRQEGAGG